MNKANVTVLLQTLVLFIIYFFTARLGLSFSPVGGYASLIWIPSGISLAALLLFGARVWPGIALGAFFANLFNGAPVGAAGGIALGNTLESIIGVYLLNRFGFSKQFEKLRDVFIFYLFSAPLSAFVSASVGVASLWLGKEIAGNAIDNTWFAWFVGDLISLLIVCPFILIWSIFPSRIYKKTEGYELLLLLIFTILILLVVFVDLLAVFPKGSPNAYLLFINVIWASLRFGQRGAVTMVLFTAVITLLSTLFDLGPFVSGSLHISLTYLQIFMGVISTVALILAASDSERRQFESRKDEFISLASHELKTPLTSIKTYIHLMQKTKFSRSNQKVYTYIQKMDTQVNKLRNLIDDLLDISKIQAGKLEMNKKKFSLLTLLNEVVESSQSIALTHSLNLKYPLRSNGFEVYADKDRINQVIVNLLTNAIKYSPKARKVILGLQLGKDSVIVYVKDYGVGIAKSEIKKLFNKYYRIHSAHKRFFPGLGIGLYISNEIIKQHEGKMWVESKLGRGSTFYFSLPIASYLDIKNGKKK